MKSSPLFCNEGAFSLIELLATISIIVLLAALLFPAAKKSLQAANTTKSISNLRQVGVATLSYANDNAGALPDKYETGKANVVSSALMDPYLARLDQAWICPIIKRLNQVGVSQADQGRFTYFWRLTNTTDGWRDDRPAVRLNTIVHSSEAMLYGNLSAGLRGGYNDGYANILFADGGVRRIKDDTYKGGDVNAAQNSVLKMYYATTSGMLRGYDF